ncbi:MAG: hypothetical protein HY744_29645 [Deltaproteobacteria bacterium]|nr:hypothetical protein [Deltaproteobacteria bacterium]
MKYCALAAALALGLLGSAAAAQPTAPPPPSAAPRAPAPAAARADVMVLHASNTAPEGIDPKIGDLPQLRRPPFSFYKRYELIQRLGAALGAPAAKLGLPDKSVLEIRLEGEDKDAQGKPRFVVSARIQKASGQDFLPRLEVKAKPGEIFFVAGQPYAHEKREGILVLGIRVLAK